ncbi:MAG: prolipoprotein diacylglyceryl transferase [Clostridia bacterium]|nr:prolipoprotein diacylglyceryl transferase [Clostridia bacterium]
MKVLNFFYFEFSTYILIIGFAFIISFIVFYKISKQNYSKLDIIYIYVINIVGFAIGSKSMSLISNNTEITIYNFINSGYSYLGGIICSILVVILYCKRYKLDFINMLSNFIVVYPLIYSISKIGCFMNGCCYGIININDINYKIPLQLVDSIIMLILFLILLVQFNKQKKLVISMFFCLFSTVRFLEDYFRDTRNILIFNFTLEQIVCGILLITNVIIIIFRMYKKRNYRYNRATLK